MKPLPLLVVLFCVHFGNSNACKTKRNKPDPSIKVFLYPDDQTDEVIRIWNETDISSIPLNEFSVIKILLHGSNFETKSRWFKEAVSAYTEENFSVITVDWSELEMIDMVTLFESLVERFVKIFSVKSLTADNIHIIGHSLGAYLAGISGNHFFKLTNQKIGRITALDPSGIYDDSCEEKLSKENAKFVDVIHTNLKGSCIDSDGEFLQLGHANFFPNGGFWQPACAQVSSECDHRIATDYHVESITSKNFVANKCESEYIPCTAKHRKTEEEAIMGEHCDFNTEGNFYLETNEWSPYAIGKLEKSDESEESEDYYI